MVTEYERVAVVVPKELKRAMIDYSTKTGRNLTWCVNTLLSKLVRGEISLDQEVTKMMKARVESMAARRCDNDRGK